MSGLITGNFNKKRYAMYLSIGTAISLWQSSLDFSNIDWTILYSDEMVSIGGIAIFLATLFHQLRLDNGLDKLLKNRSKKGYWLLSRSRTESEMLSINTARINVLTAPWLSSSWKSSEDDLDSFIREVLEDGIANETLWSVKLSIATGITTILVLSKFLFLTQNIWFYSLGIITALTLILAPFFQKEMKSLPTITQKMAILRCISEATESAISRISARPTKDPRDNTINPWLSSIQTDVKAMRVLASEKRWVLLENRLGFFLRRLEVYLHEPQFVQGLDKELANAIARAYTDYGGYGGSRFLAKNEFSDFTKNISSALKTAYNNAPPKDIQELVSSEITDTPDEFTKRIPYRHLDSRSIRQLAAMFYKMDNVFNNRFVTAITMNWGIETSSPELIEELYNHLNNPESFSSVDSYEPLFAPVEAFALILKKRSELIRDGQPTVRFIRALISLFDEDIKSKSSIPIDLNPLITLLVNVLQNGDIDPEARIKIIELSRLGITQVRNYVKSVDVTAVNIHKSMVAAFEKEKELIASEESQPT